MDILRTVNGPDTFLGGSYLRRLRLHHNNSHCSLCEYASVYTHSSLEKNKEHYKTTELVIHRETNHNICGGFMPSKFSFVNEVPNHLVTGLQS